MIAAFTRVSPTTIGTEQTIAYFKTNAVAFTTSAKNLKDAIAHISNRDSVSIWNARIALGACRDHYKRVSFFVEYFLGNRIGIFNLAPVYEIEEPFMEYQFPVGLQVIEQLLFDEDVEHKKKEMTDNADLIILTAEGLGSYTPVKEVSDENIVESVRLELIRISTLNIAGYDAPLLKTGIAESKTALLAVQEVLAPYIKQTPAPLADSILFYLTHSLQLLSATISFDDFDRMQLLTEGLMPLQRRFGLLMRYLHINKNSAGSFDKETINVKAFDTAALQLTVPLIELGRQLFSEPMLSGNNKRSCASCHLPEKYFTDGLKQSLAFDGHSPVRRNAPSLLYAAYQYGQFWDARAPTLENQVMEVIVSENEMNGSFTEIEKRLKVHRRYQRLFRRAFPAEQPGEFFKPGYIAAAIAAFERSLPVMHSAFDEYMNGDKTALTPQQIQGFNIFMGKAQCGTCHFAPLFNGLLPPAYKVTELESLGITRTEDFKMPRADTDSGRFHVFPIAFYIGAFKTPTVRNAAKTAPYMHNGSLPALADVVDFYDKGGGNGLGLRNSFQTLSERPLHLTGDEKEALISFMESLTDKPLWLQH